ncbi:FGGY-family carbohydrate kinase [Butyrivibrio sp. LC3010]|uniref:FGGY-family carbohydrate kinase n=1 Tax=Butyrivibrio sp. LC3010 TaxID=1280680 RepID=UPI0003F4CF26|nr:glycerol kinase [Butyrivibrio sp. LC3010]
MSKYIIGIDQSTQGTKAVLFDEKGSLLKREDLPHRQIVDSRGYVEHDPEEIYRNVIQVVKNLVEASGIDKNEIEGVGISNQRETSIAWTRDGKPLYNAIVWQCKRAEDICDDIMSKGYGQMIKERTGINLSPYFPAGKLSWIMKNVDAAKKAAKDKKLCCGTVDAFLVYRLTGTREFRTDYSNASRTQLFNIGNLKWDEQICKVFEVPIEALPEVTDSDGYFGETDFEGFLPHPVPIRGVLGDSHGALFGQGCLSEGMVKATYGTGSSVMMNIGDKQVLSSHGLVTSLAWKIGGKVDYVLEGNINYTGAVITWLKDDLQLINSAAETEALAREADPEDHSYIVPAFSGLGAPYWDGKAEAVICGMTRTTKKAEIVRDALDCIAYQIADIVGAMNDDVSFSIKELRVDGGPTKNAYLMQFQTDMVRVPVLVPPAEELSAMGAAYAAGIALGIYDKNKLFSGIKRTEYNVKMSEKEYEGHYNGWKAAVRKVLQP